MTQIVNFKRYGSAAALTATFGNKWRYIGRANPHYSLEASPLANPYRIRDFGNQPGATLPHYRRHLWQRIQAGDEAVINALKAIDEDTVLVCWCDGACHGQVVRDAAALGPETRRSLTSQMCYLSSDQVSGELEERARARGEN